MVKIYIDTYTNRTVNVVQWIGDNKFEVIMFAGPITFPCGNIVKRKEGRNLHGILFTYIVKDQDTFEFYTVHRFHERFTLVEGV